MFSRLFKRLSRAVASACHRFSSHLSSMYRASMRYLESKGVSVAYLKYLVWLIGGALVLGLVFHWAFGAIGIAVFGGAIGVPAPLLFPALAALFECASWLRRFILSMLRTRMTTQRVVSV